MPLYIDINPPMHWTGGVHGSPCVHASQYGTYTVYEREKCFELSFQEGKTIFKNLGEYQTLDAAKHAALDHDRELRGFMKVPIDPVFINNVCFSHRHDFGVMDKDDSKELFFDVKSIIKAIEDNLEYEANNLKDFKERRAKKETPSNKLKRKMKEGKKAVTKWYVWNDETHKWQYNHYENGHSIENEPLPISKKQSESWINKSWMSKHAYMIGGKVVDDE